MTLYQFPAYQDGYYPYWCNTCNSQDMFRNLIFVTSMANTVFTQMCSNSDGVADCYNGFCSVGYTCTVGNRCCLNANVIACADKINPNTGGSDCSNMAGLCWNSAYEKVMKEQCPKTCGYCGTVPTTTSSTCADKVNPSTGVSNCPNVGDKCNDSIYKDLMKEQCPKTCGYC